MLSGKDKYLILMVIPLLFAASVDGQAGKNYKFHFNDDLQTGIAITGNSNFIVNYSISELNIENTNNINGNFYKLSIPGHSPQSDHGKPELPVLSRLISIPENSNVKIKISEVATKRIFPAEKGFTGLLFPSQISETKNDQKQRPGFVIDNNLYGSTDFIGTDTVKIEMVGKVRSNQLATLTISPVRYNPSLNQLDIITSMKVEITFSSEKGNILTWPVMKSSLINQSLEQSVLNYNTGDVIRGYSDKPVKMVILTDTAFRKCLEPLIRWKTQKGYKIKTLYKGSKLAGNTYSALKDTLTKIYRSATINDPAPEYLLIVGDVGKIPVSEGTSNISDMYYGEFDGGDDYIPDMYIGRLPVADTNELKSVVHKIIQYEKFEVADTNNFHSRALVTAGGDDEGHAIYMNGQLKYALTNYLTPANKISEYHFYSLQSGSAEDSIIKLVNKGLSFINYSGHGLKTGWRDPAIGVTEIARMNNKNMFPFIISNACITAMFNDNSSFGNKMVVAENKGAIGFIGCSNDSYWNEDFYWTVGPGDISADPKYTETGLGAYDRLFHSHGEAPSDWCIAMGQINFAGNLAVSASATSGSMKKYYWETYSLLGDPSIIPIIGRPDSFKIHIPDTLPNGLKSLSMTIDPFAYIAISHFDTLWDATFASPSGSVTLDLPGKSNDSCLIVVTGQNKVPLIKKVYIKNVNREFINLTSAVINDNAGNNNGSADYGEPLSLNLTISNLGDADAGKLYAKISTASELVKINIDSISIGKLTGKTQITFTGVFGMKVDSLIPDKGMVTLHLMLKDSLVEKDYPIDFYVHSPVLDIVNCTISDSETGNGNFIADPGETINLIFKVINTGSSGTSGTFNITNQPSSVTFSRKSIPTGILQPRIVTNIPVTITISSSVIPGSTFDVATLLDCTPYIKNKSFSIPVGKTRESFEYQSFSVFPWNNNGIYPWIITNSQAYDGLFSARSAIIPNSKESTLSMMVNLPVKDSVSFYVRVSSEPGYDFLSFKMNKKEFFKISGETGWINKKAGLNEGCNLLEWTYYKDSNISSGSDCGLLDYILFPHLAFNKVDLKTGKIVTPQPNKSYNQETITAEIINFGRDTINGFNLAYKVNENLPVEEHFLKPVKPGDTIIVAFKKTTDLSSGGTYNIKVYGFDNNDNYLLNDTARLMIISSAIFTPAENPDNKVKIIPNPFTQNFRIAIDSRTDDHILIEIFESSGRILLKEERNLLPGENSFTISPEGLPPGLYALRIRGKTILKTVRIIKID
jgi:hypothetical protein